VSRFDVVICTHSDNDHAYGILGLMRSAAAAQPAVTVRELWLPASWRDVAACSVTSATVAEWALMPADDLWAALAPIDDENGQDADDADDEEEDELTNAVVGPVQAVLDARVFDTHLAAQLLVALKTIDLIKGIVAAAHAAHATIIWWQYFPWDTPSRRGRGPFTGVNCYPLASGQSQAAGAQPLAGPALLAAVTHTRSNTESLVWAWRPPDRPPVLFCADSPLDFPLRNLRDGMLATAAHHGSPANASTFQKVNARLGGGSALWLRTAYTGTRRQRYPSREFRSQPSRACVEQPCCQQTRDVIADCAPAGAWTLADPHTQCPGPPRCSPP
jgi:hypothetical protein